MANTLNKLSSPELKAAKPKNKKYRMRDGGGLYCEVLTSGARVWRYVYRFGELKKNKAGKMVRPEKTFTIGTYPEVGIAEARKQRDIARDKVAAGIDPSLEKQALRSALADTSFEAVAEQWFAESKSGWADSHANRLHGYLKRDVYPVIGRLEIDAVTTSNIIMIVKTVADRGAIDAAGRVKGFIQQVFDYAVLHEMVGRNTARDVKLSLILPKRIKSHFATITDPEEIGHLLRAIDGYTGTLAVRAALQLSALLFLRPSELREAEWSEIDLEKAVWTLPARRRKLLTHIKKADRPEDALIIPLSTQAISILSHLYEYTGLGKHLFPSPRGQSRVISNNALRVALRTMGYTNDDMTAHGFRALASTQLNELGYRSEVIEAQLGHKEKNEIRAAYNHAQYLPERTKMMQEWADYLDSLRSGADVVPFRNRA
jgi:integrase